MFIVSLFSSLLMASAQGHDHRHEQCVGWVNKMRAREGLPALQQWTDFEPCADQTAMRDSRKGIEYWSSGKGLFCDWAPYDPTFTVTCPRGPTGEAIFETCANELWSQKENLRVNLAGQLECKMGSPDVEQCAYGYLHMRGGHKGYNIYDRVACGIYEVDDGKFYVNLIFGRGEKVVPKMLKKAENWPYAPANWERENFQKYGYACGGDKKTHPESILVADCAETDPSVDQYSDCADGVDYRHEACGTDAPDTVGPTFSPTSIPTEMPTSEPTAQPTRSPTSSPTSQPTPSPTSAPTRAPTSSPTAAPTPSPTFVPTNEPTSEPSLSSDELLCSLATTRSICKNTSGCFYGVDGPCRVLTQSCESITNKKVCKSANPCESVFQLCLTKVPPTAAPTPAPSSTPTALTCSEDMTKDQCRLTPGCAYGKKGPCQAMIGTCDSIGSVRACGNAYGCEWNDSQCQSTTSTPSSNF